MMEKKNLKEVLAIVSAVEFRDRRFIVLEKGDGFLLQMQYRDMDVITGEIAEQHTRKWYVSPYATESEIVQTMLKCVLTSQEHIGREHFLYKGEKVYGPHLNVNDLITVAKQGRLREERRTPPGADVGPPSVRWQRAPHAYVPYDHVAYCKLCEQAEGNPIHDQPRQG
jgi:hypothetical protein